jgi:pyruvyl transferase EpsI
MGDMYFDLELLRLMVVNNFKNNKVISFPQTIDYSNNKESRYLLNLSKRIYNGHPDITMCARETVSYWKMKELYPQANVILTPDIVMTLDERTNDMRETRAIFCLRNDKEKSNNDETVNKLLNYCKCAEIDVVERDTHIGRNGLSKTERVTELQSIWTDFRKSQFVVTDRLHGMIFAYITGTPAVVLPNSNFKVAKCYEWIKDCGYIHLINDGKININDVMNKIKANKPKNIHSNIISNFDNLLS